jgi:hypothetical protein
MKTSRFVSATLVVALVASIGAVQNDASARMTHRRASHQPPAEAMTRASERPASGGAAADVAVRCSCASRASCPQIGTLAVAGHKSEPIYCNQLNGAENPGVMTNDGWNYQCAELANRWLTDGLDAPSIAGGGARDFCENADRRAYDVSYSDGGRAPVPGDLLVWDGGRFGHVGVVTSVSPTTIAFANQNYGGNGMQYPMVTTPRRGNFFGSPHNDNGLRAKCVIHPKRLGGAPSPAAQSSGPCEHVSSSHDGSYCGGSRQSGFTGGDASTLYTCRGGTTTSVRCRSACTQEAVGTDDHCT